MKKFKIIRKFRIFIAIAVLAVTSFVFLDIYQVIPDSFVRGILSTQFLPSFINMVFAGGIVFGGFLIIGLLTLAFGRVYCSTLCPFGILIDVIIFIKRKIKKRVRFKFIKAKAGIPYFILGLSIVVLLLGSIQLFSLLDPYSNFGRIQTLVIKPILISLNNLIYDILITVNNYSLHPIEAAPANIPVSVFVIIFFISIVMISLIKGRLFCTHVCPVGTSLGLLSKLSIVKVRIDDSLCTSCGACESKCKAGCISAKDKKVDFSRCVMCMDCLTVNCPVDAIDFSKKPKQNKIVQAEVVEVDNTRRKALLSLTVLPILMAGAAKASIKKKFIPEENITADNPDHRVVPISPPGSLNHNHFTDTCTSCYLCVNVCPSNVITPSLFEYGLKGIGLPQLTNKKGYCNYECTKCTDVCPNGALLPVSVDEKKTLQLGVAHFVRDLCVVITDKTDCGACSEHCPTKAVNMVIENGLFVPVVDESICVGCGACEFACPVTPKKAIFVEGHKVHKVADKPKLEKLEEVDLEEDFPF